MEGNIKIGSILLAAVLLLGGCGGNAPIGQDGNADSRQSGTGKGRYIETTANFADRLSNTMAIGNLEDGLPYVLDTAEGLYDVDQKGVHVKPEAMGLQKGLKELREEIIVLNAAIAPDGTAALAYIDAQQGNAAELEGIGYRIVDLEGNSRELTIPPMDDLISRLWYKADGSLYGTSYLGKVYEIRDDGNSCEMLFDFGENTGHVSFVGNTMILINVKGIFFYNLDKKEWLEDETASRFILEECNWEPLSENQYSILAFPGENDSFYIACEKGLYRHVLGGSTMEMVIDGSLCSLGDKSQRLMGMVETGNHEFAALHYGGKISYYVFDPEISTVPEKMLTVYSLRENDLLKQTIHAYQTQHTDVYVKLEIGIADNSSVTREDAVKILNTALMAGKGPDILILDELPVESYITKGILKDITSVMEQAERTETLFTNITHMYQSESGTYAVPTLYRMPYLAAEKDKVAQIHDITSLADVIEQLREENPEGDLIGLINEEQIIRALTMACAPAWKDETGNIDREAVTEFLTQAKRIYQAQNTGLTEKDKEYQILESGSEDPLVYTSIAFQTGAFGCDYTKLMIGYTDWCLGYSTLPALQKYFETKEIGYQPFAAQCDNIFFPYSVLGVSAVSSDEKMTADFIQLALSRQVQDVIGYGFPVNQASLEAKINKEAGIYFAAQPWYFHPKEYKLLIEWASEEEFAELLSTIKKADTPYIMGDILEDVIVEIGPKAFHDEQSIESTVDEIISRAGIYMTE